MVLLLLDYLFVDLMWCCFCQIVIFQVVGHNDVFVRLLFFQVVGRDGSEISGEAREEVMAMGKEAFVQVDNKNKIVLVFMYNFCNF